MWFVPCNRSSVTAYEWLIWTTNEQIYGVSRGTPEHPKYVSISIISYALFFLAAWIQPWMRDISGRLMDELHGEQMQRIDEIEDIRSAKRVTVNDLWW